MSDIGDAAKDTATAIGDAASKVASGAAVVAAKAPTHKWAVIAGIAVLAAVFVGVVAALVS